MIQIYAKIFRKFTNYFYGSQISEKYTQNCSQILEKITNYVLHLKMRSPARAAQPLALDVSDDISTA